MNNTPRLIAALAFAGAFVSMSLSASEAGPYIRLENGVNYVTGAKLNIGSDTSSVLNLLGFDAKDSMKVKFKAGYLYGGAVGYRFNDSFSTEIELDHARNEVDTIGGYSVPNTVVGLLGQSSVAFKQTNFLINGIYSHKLNDIFTFSLGAGLGAQFAAADLKDVSLSVGYEDLTGRFTGKRQSDAASFLAQLKTGFSLALAKNFAFDAGYKLRFVKSSDIYRLEARSTSDIEVGFNTSEKFRVDSCLNHVFSAGFTYSF